jgi:hypothetical protein
MYKKMEGIWAHCCLLAKEGRAAQTRGCEVILAKEPPTMAATERLGMGKWVILYLSTLASMFAGSIVVHHVEKPDLSLPSDDELRQRLKESNHSNESSLDN